MADTDVGKRATRRNEHGESVVCDIVDYEAGRDAGDHLVFGGTTAAEHKDGAGDVFRDWLVVGHGPGSITIH
jgi:hypothetical protein